MASYKVENQWGGNAAPWNKGGVFVLGARDGNRQFVVALDVTSSDGGRTLTGTMTYAGEGPIGFRATLTGNNNYDVENQWGGSGAPWNKGGSWIIGYRERQNVVGVKISSTDGGKTFSGTMTYAGEGPIGFRATQLAANCDYIVENQWGGSGAAWNKGGIFVLGARANQNVVALKITSSDGGTTLTGTMTYAGEGPIGFRGTLNGSSNYAVENQWGGDRAPWNPGGDWIIGYRSGTQNVVAIDVTSSDGGRTLTGTMTYANEGPIGFRGTQA